MHTLHAYKHSTMQCSHLKSKRGRVSRRSRSASAPHATRIRRVSSIIIEIVRVGKLCSVERTHWQRPEDRQRRQHEQLVGQRWQPTQKQPPQVRPHTAMTTVSSLSSRPRFLYVESTKAPVHLDTSICRIDTVC